MDIQEVDFSEVNIDTKNLSDNGEKERVLPTIENEEDFDKAWAYFQNMTAQFDYTDHKNYHLSLWECLMDNVKYKENWKEFVVQCTKGAIKTCPLTINRKAVTWRKYVIYLYDMICRQELTLDEATPALEAAEQKFSTVVHLAHNYWNVVRYHEERLEKELNWSEEFTRSRKISRFKSQFGDPYMDLESDFASTKADCEALGDEVCKEITIAYEKHKDFSAWMTSNFLPLRESFVMQSVHHYEIRRWFYQLLSHCKTTSQADAFIMACIKTDIKSICFHYIYIEALHTHPSYADWKDRESTIYSLAKMGLSTQSSCCIESMLPKMIESMMYIVVSNLNNNHINDLTGILLETSVEMDLDRWHINRKVVLYAVKELIVKKSMKKEELKTMFESCLKPENMCSLFKDYSEQTNESNIRYQKKVMDLLITYVLYEEQISNFAWQETMILWKDCLSNNRNPVALFAFAEFIRAKGSSDDAMVSYEEALDRLDYVPLETYYSRLCRLQLTTNFIKLLTSSTGRSNKLVMYSSRLIQWKFEYMRLYGESYELQDTAYDLVEPVCWDPLPNDPVLASNSFTPGNIPLVKQLSTLTVNPEREQDSKAVDEAIDKPCSVFLSNLSFTATDNHIIEAFALHNLTVKKVNLETKKNGHNYGYATAVFDSPAATQYAINNLDGIEINGRNTFVSVFKVREKSVPKYNIPKPEVNEATVLYLSDVPKEWQDLGKMYETFAPYGHIKDIAFDHDAATVVRVVFVFSSDAKNGFEQWKQGKILENTGIQMRMGYAGKKRPHHQIKKSDSAATNRSDTRRMPTKQVQSGQGDVPAQIHQRPFMVPRVLQRPAQKKLKLDVGKLLKATTSTITSQSNDESTNTTSYVEAKKPLSNEDFKKMFSK